MILETVQIGHMQVNCYILAQARGRPAIIIDPGADEEKIRGILSKFELVPGVVVNTHGHYDHIGCDDAFGVPIYAHTKERPLLANPELNLSGLFGIPVSVSGTIKTVEENDIIALDGIELKVLHIPGHTPGGVALLMLKPEQNMLFSGDNLFYRGIGRTDFPGADHEELVRNIKNKLLVLPPETYVLPGHGATTRIGEEKERNVFLREA